MIDNKTVNLEPNNKVYNRTNFIQTRCFLCLDCYPQSGSICLPCQKDLPYIERSCFICGKLLLNDVICVNCTYKKPENIFCVRPVFYYEYPIDQMIIAAKFNQNLLIASCLGKLMSQKFTDLAAENYYHKKPVLIPVPLHWSRMALRGYNQALELAKILSKSLMLPMSNTICYRNTATHSQSSLDKRQRQQNVLNAFSIVKPVTDAHIILVDDVVTTFSTCNEIARTLKQHGAARVDVWACAYREKC